MFENDWVNTSLDNIQTQHADVQQNNGIRKTVIKLRNKFRKLPYPSDWQKMIYFVVMYATDFIDFQYTHETMSKKKKPSENNGIPINNEAQQNIIQKQNNEVKNKETCKSVCKDIMKKWKKWFFYLPKTIKELKWMSCLMIDNEVNTFTDIYDVKLNLNFGIINLIWLFVFLWDITMCLTIPLYFKDSRCGYGLDWIAHGIVGAYLIAWMLAEYFFVQYLFEQIKQERTRLRFLIPLGYWFIELVTKLDIYTDMATLIEIYKWGIIHGATITSIWIYSFAVAAFVASVIFNIIQFVRFIIRRQPNSTFNPVISNTTVLCYCASLKALGKFCDKFTISYYGFLTFNKITVTKAIALMKLLCEDFVQCILQILFLIFLKGGSYTNMMIFSIFTSFVSAVLCGLTLMSDTSSKLSDDTVKDVIGKPLRFFLLNFCNSLFFNKISK